MTNSVTNALSHTFPAMEISRNVDFDKTVEYILRYSNFKMEVVTNNTPSYYAASDILLRKARLLYRNKEMMWIEAIAAFEELHAECLVKDGKDAAAAFSTAQKIYSWISEESDYLASVYLDDAELVREEIYNKADNLASKQEVYRRVTAHQTEESLLHILYRLQVSRQLRQPDKEVKRVLYLLSFDAHIFKDAFPLIVNILRELTEGNLINKEVLHELYLLVSDKVAIQEKAVNKRWYTDNWGKLHPHITEALQLLALTFLLGEEAEEDESSLSIIAARICRYLSRLPSAYSELLKNKSYTLLTGENKLNGRIRWENLCSFEEQRFFEQIILFQADEQVYVPCEQENKWIQCSNTTNTLTLTDEGFTLSPLYPQAKQSWKGRKDKASTLNNRMFVTSFCKPACLFDACKDIKDFRLYWKELAEDYPMSAKWDTPTKQASSLLSERMETDIETEALIHPVALFPQPDEDVQIRILQIDKNSNSLLTEIVNEPFRGMKARLPFTYINSCFSIITDFASLFAAGEMFRAKVKSTDNGEVLLSLIKDYNEFIYPECVRKKSLTGKIVEIREGKIWWLLSSGATSSTNINKLRKYRVGDIYKVEYIGLLSCKLKNSINIQSHLANPDEQEFIQTVLENIRDFFSFLTKEALKSKEVQPDVLAAKKENNPFFLALQNLNLTHTDEEVAHMPEKEVEVKKDNTTVQKALTCKSSLNIKLVEELIYCLDSLINDIEDPCDQFNTYNILRLLCNFVGNEELANYYSLCADYIYNVDVLTTKPFDERFSKENIQKFSNLLTKMEVLDLERYSRTLGLCNQIIQVLKSLFAPDSLSLLQSFMKSDNQTISELARYFSITQFLKNNDTVLQQLIYKNINLLLGFKEPEKKKKACLPVYFGHEGVEKEFKTSAFVHADKNAKEEQSVVLARVIASFMNTDGGTLYIGVNDIGYLTGLTQELKFTHNDSDVYLRTVNHNILCLLGEKEDRNRYQESIRCRLYEYEDGRMVLAFRASPINEVVKVRGIVYTRSASCNTVKPVENIEEFVRKRSLLKLNSVPLKPVFPTFLSTERNEYIFGTVSTSPLPPAYEVVSASDDLEVPIKTPPAAEKKAKKQNTKVAINIATSSLRCNPLQKKAEDGYKPGHLFISVFANGKIAYSASPKIGIWGDKGKVLFSYNPEDKEDLMVAVFSNGEIGLSNLKQSMRQSNTPLAFVRTIDPLFFLSPAHKTDYLLLISEKNKEKRYRIIALCDFEKSMSIQPLNTLVLEPDKGGFIFAEILTPEQRQLLNDDKVSLADFDQYNGGRYWDHSVYKEDVTTIGQLCNLAY